MNQTLRHFDRALLSGGGTESGFKWGNVMLTWTVEMAAAAAELSVMTSSL